MPSIPFVKASAVGNDFLIIDHQHAREAGGDLAAITRALCERHEGVGADGVEWLLPDPQADVRIRLINADGSDAEISGNGTRCVAAWLASQRHQEVITIRTDAGVKTCRLLRHTGGLYEIETAMGKPQVGDEFSLKLAFGEVSGIPVSMGNPHFVRLVNAFAAVWQTEAAEIGAHHDFKYGINVELVRVADEHTIEARFFERGVGETRSSGTGSCAAAVAAIAAGRARTPVHVHTQGGTQLVRWESEVFLTGTAHMVCRGEFFI